jgi:hypothetical protein
MPRIDPSVTRDAYPARRREPACPAGLLPVNAAFTGDPANQAPHGRN